MQPLKQRFVRINGSLPRKRLSPYKGRFAKPGYFLGVTGEREQCFTHGLFVTGFGGETG
jgi:hypothetical protein